uniref:GFO_IDH_MocA domain-containing protein n=1 Tax=Ascaris lumbricoides TaxID=6252 RepID=A0A0M3HNV3_ASCLU
MCGPSRSCAAMTDAKQSVGLLCSDARLVEYYVRLITKVERFELKVILIARMLTDVFAAIWCPDAERSIQLAADNDVPSVSHTAYQLISRADTQTVIIAGHPSHNALFCVQAQASKKSVICIGAAALTIECARVMAEFASRFASPTQVIYPLKYSSPFAVLRSSLNRIGTLQNVYVESTFEARICEKERLCYDASTSLHKYGHELIDALASLCSVQQPRPIAVTHRERSSVVDHFRLHELDTAHMQIGFGSLVATIRLTASSTDSLSVRIRGDSGTLHMDTDTLLLDRLDGQSVLWRGDGTVESMIRDGALNALNADKLLDGPTELSLVHCISTSLLQ